MASYNWFTKLEAWEVRARRAANGDSSSNDPKKSSQGYIWLDNNANSWRHKA